MVALGACARQSDVNRVETQVKLLRQETARADSARAVLLNSIFQLERRILDSLALQENRLVAFRGDIRSDLTEIQRQLVQVQELTGQSQQRLTDLRGQIEARSQAVTSARAATDTGAAGANAPGTPGPDQLYEVSIQQLRRGSPQTARLGFQTLLSTYPNHERAADALYFIGESWNATNADSAQFAYELVQKTFPNSSRAPSALYKLGMMAERKGDKAAARTFFMRVTAAYPRSDEATLARDRLQGLGR